MNRDKNFILYGLNPEEFSFAGLKNLAWFYLGSLLVAAILSGPIFILLSNYDNTLCNYITHKGIDKIFDRIRLIFIILILPSFLKKCGICSLKTLGFNISQRKGILSFFFIGIIFMCGITLIDILSGVETISFSRENLFLAASKLPKFLLCSIIVATLEEIIFRGAMLRIFYTAFKPSIAILLSSLFFAYLHIKIPHNIEIINDWGIFSGFKYILPMLFGFIYKFNLLFFIKVTTLGIILSCLTLKYRLLNRAIGFHAGIVFAMLTLNIFE